MAAKKKVTKKSVVDESNTFEDVKAKVENPVDEKTKKAKAARQALVNQAVNGLTSEKVASALAKTGVEVSKTLQSINDQIQEQLTLLDSLKEAVSNKEQELEELHGKDIAAKALDELVMTHGEQKAALEAEIEALQARIEEGEAEAQRLEKERKAELDKNRAREEDEYQHQLRIARRDEQDKWDAKIRERDLQREELERTKARELQNKIDAVTEREKALLQNEDRVSKLDETIAAAVEEAVKKAKSEVYAELNGKHRTELQDMRHKAEIIAFQNKSLTEKVQEMEGEVNRAREAQRTLTEKMESMARAALDATAGREALEALQKHSSTSGQQNKR